MNKYIVFLSVLLLAGCQRYAADQNEPLTAIQIQDRNGLTETVSTPDRLSTFETTDFLSSQPYKKVLRVFKGSNGKNHSKITTYHPNGLIHQYLEAEEMRARGAFREWFSNGQQRIEATLIGGTADVSAGSQQDWLFDGLSQVWDEQGQLIAKINYQKGALEGISTYFYPSGQIEKELPYTKNVLEGEAFYYTKEGSLKSKTRYRKGVKDGENITFFDNGRTACTEKYKEGLLFEGMYYDSKGELISEIANGGGFQALYNENALMTVEFRMGRPDGLVKQFTSFGDLKKTFHIKQGKKNGEEVDYFLPSELDGPRRSNAPKLCLNWNDNAIHGVVKTWYSNGQMQSQREYVRNLRTGPSLGWYHDGTLMLVEEYEEDKLISGQYFKINKTEPVSSVINGNGMATLYDEMGAPLRKVVYSKGKPLDLED